MVWKVVFLERIENCFETCDQNLLNYSVTQKRNDKDISFSISKFSHDLFKAKKQKMLYFISVMKF